jgi:hypothetical protein
MALTPGGPGGKWLGRSGPLTTAELHELLIDVRAQLEREPAVLDQFGEAILTRDLATTSDILVHLRDFFTLITALLRIVTVADFPPRRAA